MISNVYATNVMRLAQLVTGPEVINDYHAGKLILELQSRVENVTKVTIHQILILAFHVSQIAIVALMEIHESNEIAGIS